MDRRDWKLRLTDRCSRDEATGCLVWTGTRDAYGYGVLRVNGLMKKVHRLAHELATGCPPPKNMLVMHGCDNPLCVEPSHLSLGTASDNMSDKTAKRRQYRRSGPRQKLCLEDVRGIRASTETYLYLAVVYAVTLETIKNIKRGRCWKEAT